MNLSDLLTPTQAAERLGLSLSLIQRYCRQGRLGQRVGGRWLITPEQLAEFERQPRRVGKPKSSE